MDWNSWGDVTEEAGFSRNNFQKAHDEVFLIQSLIILIRKLNHFPVHVELRRESGKNKNFPAHTVWSRLGNKNQRIQKVVEFCRQNPEEYQDVLEVCEPLFAQDVTDEDKSLDF